MPQHCRANVPEQAPFGPRFQSTSCMPGARAKRKPTTQQRDLEHFLNFGAGELFVDRGQVHCPAAPIGKFGLGAGFNVARVDERGGLLPQHLFNLLRPRHHTALEHMHAFLVGLDHARVHALSLVRVARRKGQQRFALRLPYCQVDLREEFVEDV